MVATYGSARPPAAASTTAYPLDGVAVAIGRDGRIRIGGPTLFDGYDGDPELTAEVLVDGWFLTSDAGRLDEDGRLQVLGRVDDVVITGGVNVPAPAVAARLREHPDVDATSRWSASPTTSGAAGWSRSWSARSTLDEARDWVAEVHPRSWAPRELVVARRAADARQRQGRPARGSAALAAMEDA